MGKTACMATKRARRRCVECGDPVLVGDLCVECRTLTTRDQPQLFPDAA